MDSSQKVRSKAFFLAFSFFFCRSQTSSFCITLSHCALQLAYVGKVHLPILGDDGGVVIVGRLILITSVSLLWQAGYDMGRGVVNLFWNLCLELLKSRNLIFLYSNLMDQLEGSHRFDYHQWSSSATRDNSLVIILKSCLNSTGHSACTSEVRVICDRQTYVPNDWWKLMCSNVL